MFICHRMQTIIFLGIVYLMSACAHSQTTTSENGSIQLAPCPDRPNCVSSLSVDIKRRVEPLRPKMPKEKAIDRLYGLIEAMPRTKVIRSTPNYLHAEFQSVLFKFVDDVEFAYEDASGMIHIRSASRVGYWDFGVNRRRVERIREEFNMQDN